MTTRTWIFRRNAWGRVTAKLDGQAPIDNIAFVPLFPVSAPRQWISVLDESGRELTTIHDLDSLDPNSREVLIDELTYRDFVPKILRIYSVSGTSEPCEWHVETNHGATRFVLKAEDDIRRLSVHEVMIIDANGSRYRVDDTRTLDSRSRRYIEWYV